MVDHRPGDSSPEPDGGSARSPWSSEHYGFAPQPAPTPRAPADRAGSRRRRPLPALLGAAALTVGLSAGAAGVLITQAAQTAQAADAGRGRSAVAEVAQVAQVAGHDHLSGRPGGRQ